MRSPRRSEMDKNSVGPPGFPIVPLLMAACLWLVLVQLHVAEGRLKDFRYMSKNVTSTLDELLSVGRYDRRIRPGLGGPPTLVTVSIYIKSMSEVSETDQKYSMDTYFRQSWYDPRLEFSLPGMDEFSMSWLFLERVWKPDTFILNGHRSYLHRITVPNKFLRVRSDGFMTYSMRVTLQASCPMHLRKFPLDSQSCPLLIGSFGYTSSDLIYAWHPTGVGLEPGVELAQYDLVNITISPEKTVVRNTGLYSMISATFHLKRNTGYYTLQVFVPCGLIVCSSWVSFWIDPDAVPARVSLAVTTVLSMTTMGFGGRANMPRVNYATALDWFIILCFTFVFAVMVQYAAINFIDKVTGDLRRILEERKNTKKKSSVADVDPSLVGEEVVPVPVADGRSSAASGPPAVGDTTGASLAPSDSIAANLADLAGGAKKLVINVVRRVSTALVEGSVQGEAGADGSEEQTDEEVEVEGPEDDVDAEHIYDQPSTPPAPVPAILVTVEPIEVEHTQDPPGASRQPSTSSGEDVESVSAGVDVCVRAQDDRQLGHLEQVEVMLVADVLPSLPSTAATGAGSVQASPDYLIPIEVELHLDPAQTESAANLLRVPAQEATLSGTLSLRRWVSAPYRLWEQARFLPSEEDVTRLMQSEEEPDKFSRIDIVSRKVFPIAFGLSIIFYWIMYGFYISDKFPGEENRDVLYDIAPPKTKH